MGHTNSTVNYNLPQFVETDKPSWLGDVNGAFLAIDTAIAAAKSTADSAAGGVSGLQTTVGGHTTQIGTLTETVTAQGGTLNAVTALIGNGKPTTTDQTIIGAINEINDKVSGYVEVTPTASETWASILGRLKAAISGNTITPKSVLIVHTSVGDTAYNLYSIASGVPAYVCATESAAGIYIFKATVDTSGSFVTTSISNAGAFTRNDASSNPTNAEYIRLYF